MKKIAFIVVGQSPNDPGSLQVLKKDLLLFRKADIPLSVFTASPVGTQLRSEIDNIKLLMTLGNDLKTLHDFSKEVSTQEERQNFIQKFLGKCHRKDFFINENSVVETLEDIQHQKLASQYQNLLEEREAIQHRLSLYETLSSNKIPLYGMGCCAEELKQTKESHAKIMVKHILKQSLAAFNDASVGGVVFICVEPENFMKMIYHLKRQCKVNHERQAFTPFIGGIRCLSENYSIGNKKVPESYETQENIYRIDKLRQKYQGDLAHIRRASDGNYVSLEFNFMTKLVAIKAGFDQVCRQKYEVRLDRTILDGTIEGGAAAVENTAKAETKVDVVPMGRLTANPAVHTEKIEKQQASIAKPSQNLQEKGLVRTKAMHSDRCLSLYERAQFVFVQYRLKKRGIQKKTYFVEPLEQEPNGCVRPPYRPLNSSNRSQTTLVRSQDSNEEKSFKKKRQRLLIGPCKSL